MIDGKDAVVRKGYPLFSGCLAYFPDALLEVAKLSKAGNDQHNPGQPLHWSKHKSSDHGDCMLRHQLDAGKIDDDGQRHSAKVAWRALAQLQIEIEAHDSGLSVAAYMAELESQARMSMTENTLSVTGVGYVRIPTVPEAEAKPLPFKVGDVVAHVEDGSRGMVKALYAQTADVYWFATEISLEYPFSALKKVEDSGATLVAGK